ncbi:MAG: hypothetical protein ACLFWM_03470 [Actinomycetota bacterium]
MNLRLDVEVVSLEPTPAVVAGRKVRDSGLDAAVADGIQRVRRAVTAARVPTSGPPFVRFLSSRSPFRLEIGLPLDGPHSIPTMRATLLPGGEAATLWHGGPHSRTIESLHELEGWVEAHGEPAADPWQWYWTEPDAPEPQMQLVWPMRLR